MHDLTNGRPKRLTAGNSYIADNRAQLAQYEILSDEQEYEQAPEPEESNKQIERRFPLSWDFKIGFLAGAFFSFCLLSIVVIGKEKMSVNALWTFLICGIIVWSFYNRKNIKSWYTRQNK